MGSCDKIGRKIMWSSKNYVLRRQLYEHMKMITKYYFLDELYGGL